MSATAPRTTGWCSRARMRDLSAWPSIMGSNLGRSRTWSCGTADPFRSSPRTLLDLPRHGDGCKGFGAALQRILQARNRPSARRRLEPEVPAVRSSVRRFASRGPRPGTPPGSPAQGHRWYDEHCCSCWEDLRKSSMAEAIHPFVSEAKSFCQSVAN